MLQRIANLRRHRLIVLSLIDSVAWILAFVAVAMLGHQSTVDLYPESVAYAAVVGAVAAALFLLAGLPVHLHRGRAVLGSFEDAVLLSGVAGVVGLVTVLANFALGPWYRTLVAVAAPLVALMLMLWTRGAYRASRERAEERPTAAGQSPVVIIGAGEIAQRLVHAMLRDEHSKWRPVAMVDDDPLKRHRRIRSVPVAGTIREFARVARDTGAEYAVLALPDTPSQLVRELTATARVEGVGLKVLPSTGEMLEPQRIEIKDIRDINVDDLLGRHQVNTDVSSIAGYVTGQRVLVTGAGGSIGSELCRQLAQFQPSELIMLDRDESALHAVELSLHGKALLDSENTVLADIRDEQFIGDLFESRKPEVVFHAAALKHLPLLEKAPGEAVKTNVWGTLAVLEAAVRSGVDTFVNVSTDKAANPHSVLGYSKRLAEGLTAATAVEAPGSFVSVRFGNVLGSRGSVLSSFAAQIADGGPVTVTDPRVTRYFMTIREAVQLVIQAGAIGKSGEVLVLDMGEPKSIDAVARQLIDLSGEQIDVVYTGLREGEKLHEELFGSGEPDVRSSHPLISRVTAPPYAGMSARAMDAWAPPEKVRDELKSACEALSHGLERA